MEHIKYRQWLDVDDGVCGIGNGWIRFCHFDWYLASTTAAVNFLVFFLLILLFSFVLHTNECANEANIASSEQTKPKKKFIITTYERTHFGVFFLVFFCMFNVQFYFSFIWNECVMDFLVLAWHSHFYFPSCWKFTAKQSPRHVARIVAKPAWHIKPWAPP